MAGYTIALQFVAADLLLVPALTDPIVLLKKEAVVAEALAVAEEGQPQPQLHQPVTEITTEIMEPMVNRSLKATVGHTTMTVLLNKIHTTRILPMVEKHQPPLNMVIPVPQMSSTRAMPMEIMKVRLNIKTAVEIVKVQDGVR